MFHINDIFTPIGYSLHPIDRLIFSWEYHYQKTGWGLVKLALGEGRICSIRILSLPHWPLDIFVRVSLSKKRVGWWNSLCLKGIFALFKYSLHPIDRLIV